jgi:hypothetical protein
MMTYRLTRAVVGDPPGGPHLFVARRNWRTRRYNKYAIREPTVGFLKFLTIIICVLIGATFIAWGFGATIPVVEYKGVTVRDVPVGFGFLVLALLLAKYWEVSSNTKHMIVSDGPFGKITETFEATKKSIRSLW